MPWLEPRDLRWLIDAYRATPQPIAVPYVEERRGNPVIIDQGVRGQVIAGDARLSCRRFIDENPALVAQLAAPNDHFLRDLDHPDDYSDWLRETSALMPG
jgi:CTP:molybdopterin cytidylyltransferase MocA